MDLPILSAAVIGLAALFVQGGDSLSSGSASSKAAESGSLVGTTLWATEDAVERFGIPSRAEDLALEGLGTVAAVRTSPDGAPIGVTVAVGGLWGWGAQEVEVGPERLRLVRGAGGTEHLVLDLSASGAEPPLDGQDL